MRKQETERFIYSAYAQSIGATLDSPLPAFLDDAPSAALPITGGQVAHAKEGIRLNLGTAEIIKVGRASARVLGERSGEFYLSLATATLEKLNILDVVTADRVVAKVTSLYPVRRGSDRPPRRPALQSVLASLEGKGDGREEEGDLHPAKFFISGSHFDNLKIDGKPYDCVLDQPEHEEGFMVRNTQATWTSIFKDCGPIHIEQFGTIHLGEKYMYGGKVILNMFRVELGCPDSGSTSGGTASSNGKDA